jgi:hypothetical protein
MLLSIIIVSFNTKELLKECLIECKKQIVGIKSEIIVVDNDSKDGSFEMLKKEFPEVISIQSGGNIGFAAANNLGYKIAKGEYILLLNSDAFIKENGLKKALEKIKNNKEIAVLGAKLIGKKGEWQPSARTFPSIKNDFFILSGLSFKFKNSKIFGKPDMTYKDQNQEIYCDWIPGAFALIRKEALEDKIFDERFFMYFEEVDMCLNLKRKGWKVLYYPEVEVVHLGGASTSVFSSKLVSRSGMQMTLWRLQSQYLFYRKNYGFIKAFISKNFEYLWNFIRMLKNKNNNKSEESKVMIEMIKKAWENTIGGQVSPKRPWNGI